MGTVCEVLAVWLMVCCLGGHSVAEGALTALYMPTSCGVLTSVSPSVQLESGTGLTYTNNMDCNITFTVTSPFLLLANFKRFELEPKYSGICNDYVNLHDGGDVSSSTINSDVLCGNSLVSTTYVTSGQELTVHFVTDSTAVYQGFNIIITAVTVAPCGADQFQCNTTNYCIDSTLYCDNYDQCGDASDEVGCTASSSSTSSTPTSLIVGLTLGLLALLLLLAFLLYRRHRRNQWRRFTGDHIHREDLPDPDPAYPVTHKYFRGIRGHPDLRAYDGVAEEKKKEGVGEKVVVVQT